VSPVAISVEIEVVPGRDLRLGGGPASCLDNRLYVSQDAARGEMGRYRVMAQRESARLNAILAGWNLPPFPLQTGGERYIVNRGNSTADRRSIMEGREKVLLLDWLYRVIRWNIKRGRAFELGDVLDQGEADCLGYAKLLAALASELGLELGVVDVVVDNGGRYVPHTANIARFGPGRWQLVDLWYGSQSINHRRIGARVKQGGRWRLRDIGGGEFGAVEDIRSLPPGCVDAITYYIRGNRHLSRGELDEAISCYQTAISLYPSNSRLYFNRAVAYERRGEQEKAERDYAVALGDEDGLIRVLGREHEEVTRLIELDEKGIGLRDQGIYLWRRGFVTGREEGEDEVATEFGISREEVAAVMDSIEGMLG